MRQLFLLATKTIVLGILALWHHSVFATPVYTITDLGLIWSDHTRVTSINNSGQYTGYIDDRAFIGDSNGITDLGLNGGSRTMSNAINNNGEVVGYYYTNIGSRGFVGDVSGISEFSGLVPGSSSIGTDINDVGQITGYSDSIDPARRHAFIKDQTGIIDLGNGGGLETFGYAINNNGLVTGTIFQSNGDKEVFIGDENGLTNLGTLGGNFGSAKDINDNGVIVGHSRTGSGTLRAFVGDQNGLTELGTLGGNFSQATSINNAGIVVGTSYNNQQIYNAMYYSETGGMLNLNDLVTDLSGWDYLRLANDITDTGLILGDGYTSEGEHHIFILSEITNTTPVPEPTTILLSGLGLLGMGVYIRRRKAK